MTFTHAVKTCFQRGTVFGGRAGRPEFWYFWLFQILIQLVLTAIEIGLSIAFDRNLEQLFDVISGIIGLIFLIPTLAVGARRLHDIDRTGWWQLLYLVPVIGWIALLVFWCLKGTPGDNRFGPQPD